MIQRFNAALADIADEAIRSIEKHGEQLHVPMGTGPGTHPLVVGVDSHGPFRVTAATTLADVFTRDTKARTANEGGDGSVTWWHILRDEVFEAAAEDDPARLRAELVQVAAVALKMIDALDRVSTPEPEPTSWLDIEGHEWQMGSDGFLHLYGAKDLFRSREWVESTRGPLTPVQEEAS